MMNLSLDQQGWIWNKECRSKVFFFESYLIHFLKKILLLASSPPPQQVNLTPNPMIDNYTIVAAAGMEEAIRLADRLHDMDQLKPKDDIMITETTFGQECKEEDQNTKSKQVVLK